MQVVVDGIHVHAGEEEIAYAGLRRNTRIDGRDGRESRGGGGEVVARMKDL
jgi:hypothetical protein